MTTKLSRHGGRRSDRQLDRERRAQSRRGEQGDGPAVRVDDLTSDVEAEAVAPEATVKAVSQPSMNG